MTKEDTVAAWDVVLLLIALSQVYNRRSALCFSFALLRPLLFLLSVHRYYLAR